MGRVANRCPESGSSGCGLRVHDLAFTVVEFSAIGGLGLLEKEVGV